MADYEALQVGQVFAGRYRVEKFLAKGGFGAVYVAEQIETELKVALKVLWPHVLHSQDAVEKFRLEARVAGRVNSEHIVKVFDAGFDGPSGMPFLVMELLRGAELDKIVESQGPLPAPRLISYFRQIASGLDRAHGYVTREGVKTPIVHRDLKPENIFLAERETGEPLIKILDFGIAKVLTESTKVSQEVKGTPLYMAFEQVAAGKITPQTDIWPLGLIAFFLLTGKPYWKAANHGEGTITQLFGEVLSLPIEPASLRASQLGTPHALPPAFDAWFARCLEREPARRFASAGECAIALAEALGVTAAGSTQVSAMPPVQVASADAGAAAQTLGRTTGAPIVTHSSPPVKPRSFKWVAILAVLAVGGAIAAQRLLPTTAATGDTGPAASPSLSGDLPTAPVLASATVAATPPQPEPAPSASAAPPAPSAAASPPPAAPAAPATRNGKAGAAAAQAAAVAPAVPAAPAAPTTPPPVKPPTGGKPDLYGDR